MIIFGGSAGETLAVRTSLLMGEKLGKMKRQSFPDGEQYVKIEDEIKGQDVAYIQPLGGRPDQLIMEYLLTMDALKSASPRSISVVVPYLAYARQDARFHPGEPLSFHLVARLLESAGPSRIFTIDVHLQRVPSLKEVFKIPAANLTAVPLIAEYINRVYQPKNAIVIGPDDEAEQWAKVAAAKIKTDYAVLSKTRFSSTEVKVKVKGGGSVNVKGRDAIIIDDIISTGNTIVEAANLIKKEGARKIFVGCTHPVLSLNAMPLMLTNHIDAVVGTDTFAGPISFVSVAPVIAEALKGKR
jgi:ribose-phosphate pyrophosphokinase